ncbi:histidine--tRNA ligase [bacterium]|nr:histidine--tRNA ligase [bacterium]
MNKITPRIFKGTRDFLPDEMIAREEIINTLKRIFQKYGFQPLETPSIEFLDILTGKYGKEGEKLIYKLAYKGGNELALRFDLTVPLCRVMAMNPGITKPFKRYQIQPVWRADKPQLKQGRFREFFQCDIDTVGSDSIVVDAEFILITDEILKELGFTDYKIRVNSRKVLRGIIEYLGIDISSESVFLITLDKLDKIGKDGVYGELSEKGFSKDVQKKLDNILNVSKDKKPRETADILKKTLEGIPALSEGIEELETLFDYLDEAGMENKNYTFDLYLARGLDYYTGIINESVLEGLPRMGSLTGGGRYDNLIGTFINRDIPASGTTIGLDRIFAAMQQLNILPGGKSRTQVLVSLFDKDSVKRSIEIASLLRGEGLNVEVYYETQKIHKQFSYADKKGIPLVVIEGPDEVKNGKVTVKNMTERAQVTIHRGELIETIRKMLSK